MKKRLYAQGDILLEPISQKVAETSAVVPADPDGAVVLGRGEKSGHRHAIRDGGGAVLMRNPDGAGRSVPAELYVGHLVVEAKSVKLSHEEHATISLPKGTYVVRRQRQYTGEAEARARLVAD